MTTPRDILLFYLQNKQILIETQQQRIEKYYQKYFNINLKSLENEAVENDHYTNCVWSQKDATEGPDTCYCNVRDAEMSRIRQIVEMLQKIQEL